ncbi:MAG: CheR family methyltransferase, partial [Anaerolineae bacterium]
DAFAALKEQVIPQLYQHKQPGQPIRVWVPGCATGEEAYSIAILLQEYAEHTLAAHRLSDNLFQIFATDIDDHVIETARAGVYPESIAADVSQERLRRFFTKDGVTYQVKQSIRDKIVFATQSIIKDPPFSRLDMISCRNLLIYLGADLQEKILPLFHYALNPGGVLFLGSSETIGNFRDLFAVVDGKWKLYRHKGEATMRLPGMRFAVPTLPGERQAGGTAVPDPAPPLQRLAETILLENFTAACVIVNEKLEIVYTHGRTGRYLEPAQGKADWTIASMARSGLGLDLRTALRKARARNQPVRYENITLKTNGSEARINLIVKPIQEPPALQGLMAIVFEEVTLPAAIQQELDASPTSNDERVVRLEGELRATREHLQAANEELETTNEELKSTNEELQLSLEEVQSANEELRTSQEELRSVNEELLTANAELSHKMAALTQANNDMSNLVANTDIGVVFVDTDLMVQFFTPAATRTVHLIDSDIGRPLSHIATNLQYDALITDVQTLLRTLSPQEFEAQSEDGRRYLVRLRPY